MSEIRGDAEGTGISLFQHIRESAERFFNTGRPNFLGIAQGETTAFLFGDHPVAYRLLLIALSVAAAGLLYVLVRQLGMSRPAALLTMVLLAGSIQLRSYHDPVLGYWGTTQLVLIFTLASVIVFHRALRDENRRLFWISVALFVPAPLLYEAAYPLVAMHLGVALIERRGRAALRASAPFLVIGVGFVLLSLYLRRTAVVIPQGYDVGGSPLDALRVYVVQLFAAIPASNLFFKADHGAFIPLGAGPTAAELVAATWRGLVVFGAVALLSWRLATRRSLPEPRTLGALAIVGGLLWTTSVMIISTSPKYQTELVPGRTHLPSLFQVFAWAMVASAALFALLRVAVRRSRAAVLLVTLSCAGLLGLAAGMTAFSNVRTVALEIPVTEARGLLERAAGDGVFGALPEEGTLLFAGADLTWGTGSWFQSPGSLESMLMDKEGRRLDGRIVPPADRFDCAVSGKFPPEECEPVGAAAAFVRVRPRQTGGTVVVASIPGRARVPQRAVAQRLRVYETSESGTPRPPVISSLTTRGRVWTSAGLTWRTVETGDDWAIFEATLPPATPVLGSAFTAPGVRDFYALGPPNEIVRIYGTKRLLP